MFEDDTGAKMTAAACMSVLGVALMIISLAAIFAFGSSE
jgi:hypothetical protein